MFICRACLRSLSGVSPSPVEARLLRPLRRSTGLGYGRRTFAVTCTAGATSRPDVEDVRAALLAEAPGGPTQRKAGLEKSPPIPGSKEGKDTYTTRLEWVVKKHLTYLKDPVDIAAHVRKALDKGSFQEAVLMARMASKNTKVEVSWNHLIDYQMKNHRLHAAIKLYNEMKKRQQVPNAKTYTIIFRGCALSIHPRLAVSEALKLYNFMVRVGAQKPNTIHMNAVLEVCARAGDLDSLFSVLATADNTVRAPDALTYTIILNALRHDAQSLTRGLGLIDSEVKQVIAGHIDRARALWADVTAKWRNGKLLIDEPLVCAMGRLLALGDYHSNDSILDLLEQTMKIPRFDKISGSLPVAEGHAAATGEAQAPAEGDAATTPPPPQVEAPDTRGIGPIARKELAASKPGGLYAKPDTNTLSLLMTALAHTRKTSLAPKYWDYFTQVLGVKPEGENYARYFKALSVGHASAQTAKVVAGMPIELLSHVTFRVAFGICIHDSLNPSAFDNACKIFDVMAARLRYPDPLAMRLFLHSARDGRARLDKKAAKEEAKKAAAAAAEKNEPEEDEDSKNKATALADDNKSGKSKPATTADWMNATLAEESLKKQANRAAAPTPAERAHGKRLMVALDRMWEPFRILAGSFSYPTKEQQPAATAAESPAQEREMQRGDMQEVMATGRVMISAIVWVLDHGVLDPVVDRQRIRELKNRQTVLVRLVQRYIAKLYPEGQVQKEKAQAQGVNKKKDVPEFGVGRRLASVSA